MNYLTVATGFGKLFGCWFLMVLFSQFCAFGFDWLWGFSGWCYRTLCPLTIDSWMSQRRSAQPSEIYAADQTKTTPSNATRVAETESEANAIA